MVFKNVNKGNPKIDGSPQMRRLIRGCANQLAARATARDRDIARSDVA